MPRRSLLLLATLTAAALFSVFLLVPATPHAWKGLAGSLPQWRSSSTKSATPSTSTVADLAAADSEALKALGLTAPFDFRRRCFDVRPTKRVQRTSLASVKFDLLAIPPSQGLTMDDLLPPCQESLKLDVPFFDPRAKIDTSALFLGVATTMSRVHASLPAFSRWLSGTGSPLLVLLVDQPDLNEQAAAIGMLRAMAADLEIDIIFEPYNGDVVHDSEGLKNFALAEAFDKYQRPGTRWYGIIDDDTFFVSLPAMLQALKPYDPARPWYIGALTEGLFRVAQEGFKAWGGAGFFISPPLMSQLAASAARCRPLDQGFGDILWRDCILEVTSPTVKLTQLPGLNQIDLWGDISGWYESGLHPMLTIHHWKSWHFHPIPLASFITSVAGPDTFLQRYVFNDDVVMTNGFSIVHYPHGLPDLNLTELTFAEDVNKMQKPGQLMFHYSLGATRPALQVGREKVSWELKFAAFGPGAKSSDGQKNILNWVDPKDKSGEFKRQQSTFRDWISSEEGAEFPAEEGRYHLYVSYACPWAHRALIVRKLKGLEHIIPFTSVHWHMLEKGWRFATKDGEAPGENVTPDPIHPDFKHIRELYFENNKDYGGRFTVPTLYDKKQKRIVNNESSEIIRMFYHAFDKLLPEKYAKLDLLPEKLKESIEATNEWTTQEAYEKNVKTLFAALDRAEAELAKSPGPYYHGADPTEADVRLYTTIIRFDAVYVQHFKCNLREIRSGYPALHKWVRYCYWKNEAFGGTTEFTHIKNHYTKSHHQINPLSITPLGPDPDILPMDEEVPAVKAALK
ncbi:S-glutathionyl-(chloro)hydroquinone reductase [Friedmanniomyces endolithicus]|nr:S-glutathionyl-(chloro)hydroquinone reductase [Friedmanniomyces endolithicus]